VSSIEANAAAVASARRVSGAARQVVLVEPGRLELREVTPRGRVRANC